jgi:outer membrane protein OmpA-like peptidoglycan-associated protein
LRTHDVAAVAVVVDAKYDLLERGGYIPTGYKFDPVVLNAKLPLEFFEARNALRIAQSEGADRYAIDSYQHAVRLMDQADAYATEKHINKKAMIAVAREAVQTAEDAREIAVTKIEQERVDAANRAAADREATAKAQTISAEADTAEALRARDEAERQKREAQASALQQQQTAEAEAERNRAAAAAAAAASEQKLQQAERDREELRARLLQQFNAVLETRDTARGLVVNMSDVLFDTGKHTLRPLAREKLAKISGIVLAYPALTLGIEGNTDSVGSDEYNQGLSERRAEAVPVLPRAARSPGVLDDSKGLGRRPAHCVKQYSRRPSTESTR